MHKETGKWVTEDATMFKYFETAILTAGLYSILEPNTACYKHKRLHGGTFKSPDCIALSNDGVKVFLQLMDIVPNLYMDSKSDGQCDSYGMTGYMLTPPT